MAIRISPKRLPAELRARAEQMPTTLRRGIYHGAMRGQAHLVRRSPKDLGQFKAAWKVRRRGDELSLENSAPYAGILEFGARPHPVSREGMEAIYGWVRRVMGAEPKEAQSIAYAIANKLRRQGQEPTYFVRDSLDDLRKFVTDEVDDAIRKDSHKPARRR